jgi:hypothetical protein
MAKVSKAKRKVGRKSAALDTVSTNTAGGDEIVDMNFKVSLRRRNEVKMQALARGMTVRAMVDAALEYYWAAFPKEIVVR